MIGFINSTSRLIHISSTICTQHLCRCLKGKGFCPWHLTTLFPLPFIQPHPTSAHPRKPFISGGWCISIFLSMTWSISSLDMLHSLLMWHMPINLHAAHQSANHCPLQPRPLPPPPLEPSSLLLSSHWLPWVRLYFLLISHFLWMRLTSCDASICAL